MATMRDFLDNMAAPVRNRSAVRLALHNPNARSASDIAGVERTARTLGMGYGLADAGGQDAALEAKAREIEQNPVADAWTAKAEENIAFLNEDRQALADVYDSLADSGILHEADADRETVINASGAGDNVAAAWKRGVIQNRIAGYGLQFQRGEYESLDELRANILAAQRELEALRGDASDILGIYGAIEQLPRMIGYDAQYAGAGALVGGTIGSVVPGIGTAAGAGVGGAAGMAYTVANSEQGSFAAELLVQKDDAGNYLDLAAIREAASLYGLLSGAVEVGGDALMFKLMKPLGGAVREAFGKKAARDAIREAAANRSLRPALRSFAGGAGKAAAVEGAQEFAQEGFFAQIEATTKNLLSDAGTNYYREHQAGAFSREGLSRMLEAGVIAAKAGPWFYAIPGGIRLTLDTRSALRAREFAEAHKELADKVAATKTRELSPARMESYLQTAGLDGEVLIPADAAWELQRKGTDLAGPLGWDTRDMEEAAALGHDIVMPAARLQAYLQPEQMKAVADIMRESPYAKSALEAANLNEDLPADMDGLIERAEDDALERSAIEGELERLRAEMTRAVQSAPHLMGQITSGTDAETSVGQYVDAQLGLIVRRARELARMGVPVSDTLSRVSFKGPVEDEQGRMVTQEEADALAGRNAEGEALAPFWDAVWGRLNADSLRVDFPDARRELAYQHGRGLFAGKGEGLSVDALADELKNRGLLEEDADSSTLIERLKGMRRPDRRTRGKVFFQPLNAGVNLDRLISTTTIQRKYPAATLKEKRNAVSKGEKTRVLQAFRKGVRNKDTGWLIGMSGTDFDEHLKSDARSQFVMDQYEAVSALPELMEKAVLVESHDDSHGRAEVRKVHRFYAPLTIDGDSYSVVLTVKEFQNGILSVDAVSPMKLYHHRLEKKMPPAELGATASQGNPDPHTGSIRDYSLRELLEDVNDSDGVSYFQTEAETRLQNDIAVWEKAVDDIIAAGKVPSSPVQMLAQTPLVMNLLGTDTLTGKAAATGGIYAAPHLFDGTHPNMTPDMWKQIPSAMADPIAVFDSASPQGRLNGDIVFMLELTDANGATVVVPVALDSRGKLGAQLNIAKSAYAKESNGIPSDGWFIKQAQKNARYINGQKWKRWSIGSGAASPLVASNASGNTIYTEIDLDKLKSAHPGFYQSASSALGSTTFDASGNYVIQLFRGANLSTLTHETAHVFFLEMERLEREGLADERMLADLAALREWTAAMDDDAALKAEYDRYQKHAAYGGAEFDALPDYLKEDARSRAKQEMLARGFEQYLREGKAPSPQLEGVFARFRKWLMRVYRDALDLHVELTDDVRDVFDRMLVHEEEMELRAEADSSPLIQRSKGMRERQKTASVSLLQTPAENDVVYPDNGKPVGQVTPEIAATLRMNKPGVIVLDDIGLQHIEERHSKEIRSLGFPDGREFVGFVLGNLDAVYDVDGRGRKYDLVSRAMRTQGRVMIRLEFAESGDFYQVVTAGPVRPEFYHKKAPLWERAQSSHSVTGTPDAISGQSGKDSIVSLGPDGNPLFQTGNEEAPLVREGMTRKPDSAAAKVVSIPENAVPEFSGMKDFADWLKDMLAEGGDVTIASTGQVARFTRTNVGASVKRSRSREHRNAYAALREMIQNAEYDHYEMPDERHPRSGGQDVYHSALRMGGKLYSVKLKLDVVTEDQRESERRRNENTDDDVRYKDHKLIEIEIASARTRGAVKNDGATQTADAISEVTLGVLRGSVKPSGLDGGTLFQGISDEVRDEFDRMLAHEEEMDLRAEADSSPLIQRPKGMRERQTVFQTEEKNAAGVPLSRVTSV